MFKLKLNMEVEDNNEILFLHVLIKRTQTVPYQPVYAKICTLRKILELPHKPHYNIKFGLAKCLHDGAIWICSKEKAMYQKQAEIKTMLLING